MQYTVRLAQPQDIAALPDIERAAAQQFYPYLEWLNISEKLLENLTTLSFLRQAQVDGRLWVAAVEVEFEAGAETEIEEQAEAESGPASVVGFIVAKFLTQGCFIVELDVHPNHGRQGIGSALVEACCQNAQQQGVSQVLLTTFRRVPWNIPFYRRLGFEVLPPEQWSPEMMAIVQHEARYGFAPEKRAVMMRQMPTGGDSEEARGRYGWQDTSPSTAEGSVADSLKHPQAYPDDARSPQTRPNHKRSHRGDRHA
jgi:GNAT superfamily N-acetyltransferase